MYSFAEENYLKAIYHLENEIKGGVSTNAIAKKMETKPSSVTDMVQKLADKKLLSYVKYRGSFLTRYGKIIAANIIRKHRLWEVFLVKKLNFQWDEVHDMAEQLEHIQSDKLISRLDQFLEHPDFDPHGDPIPDEKGNIKPSDKKLLSKLEKNHKYDPNLEPNRLFVCTHLQVNSRIRSIQEIFFFLQGFEQSRVQQLY